MWGRILWVGGRVLFLGWPTSLFFGWPTSRLSFCRIAQGTILLASQKGGYVGEDRVVGG